MALVVKPSGEAVVENPVTTGTAAGSTAADSGNSEKVVVKATTPTSTNTGSDSGKIDTAGVPKNVTGGMSFEEVKAGLSEGYDSRFDEQIADLYNRIVGRKAFTYNPSEDAMFQNYEQLYTKKGKEAMRDTMGQAAALTGGYGSSYGQAVGQQQYDAYMQELLALLPELEQNAFQRYAAEGDRLNELLGLAGTMDDRDLQKYKLDQTLNQNIYDRFMSEAALKGAAGDFSGYKDIFGAESAGKMENAFNLDRLLPLLDSGLINDEQFNQILGPFLQSMGIVTPEATANGGGGDPWDYGGVGWNPGYMQGKDGGTLTASQVVQSANDAYVVGDITATQRDEIINAAWGR